MSKTYKQIIAQAAHYKAIGQTDIYLDSRQDEYPWDIATSCEPGGTHRLDISTSVLFSGMDPQTGLIFKWSFDIEPMSANGKGSYEIDAKGCADVLSKLPSKAATAFRQYLGDCVAAIEKRGAEYFAIYQRQMADAAVLKQLAKP